MNISFENPDKVNGLLTITVEEADYQASVEKTLKDYRKKANYPGFRPGMVPMGLIKKQFGASAKMEAINKLIDFRTQEGAALQKKFTEKIDNISALLKSIEPFEKSRVPKIKDKIIDGLKQIPEVDYDKNRLEQELIYYIEKLDISEEKQRLTNHLKYFRETMAECGHGVGKKLGFIAQEMGREINTTGSKSNQAEMQNIVVKMKDELEQIKEQVLNAL